MRLLASTAQHLLEVKLSESSDPTRNYEIADVEPWLSGSTFATAAQSPQGAITTIHHKNTLDAVGGKLQDMYVVQFTPEGGIIDRSLQDNFKHAHDVLYAHDRMYVTNTAYNQIIISDGQTGLRLTIGPEGRDTHHLNNLWADEDSVYVMAHNGNLPDDQPGQIFELEPDGSEVKNVIDLPHRKCHHFFRVYAAETGVGDSWYYTASDHGRVIRYRPKYDAVDELVVGGFPKGLIRVSDDLAIFGTSEHTPFVERRVKSHAQIGVLDLNEFEVLELLDLTLANEGVGQINDLCLLSD